MKSAWIITTGLLSAGVMLAAAEPFCHWDFEKIDNAKKQFVSTNGKFRLSARTMTDQGFKGNGIRLDDKHQIGIKLIDAKDWKAFTLEMKFKLDKGVDKSVGNALFCYCKHDWNRSQFLLRITKKNQLEASFNQGKPNPPGKFVVTSKVLKFEPGKFYTVRVASQDGGALKIWLDGELVAMKEKGSWGFNRLTVNQIPKSNYLFLMFGNDRANSEKIYRPLNGIADDIKIWNEFKEPDLIGETSAAGQISIPLITEKKSTFSGKFTVLDRPGKLAGTWVRPEQKFLDAAADAEIKLTEQYLIVRVKAPIAAGTEIDRNPKATWNGDVIEFFFCPDPKEGSYYQYAANVSGFKAAISYTPTGTMKQGFKSGSSIKSVIFPDRWEAEFIIPRKEIGLNGNIDGKISTANFTRSGKSGGGSSTWAPVGNVFNTPSKFRQVVFGSYQAALLKKLAASRAEFNGINGKAEQKKAIAAELDSLEKLIRKNGNKAEFFTGLSKAIDRMAIRYTQLRFSGISNLIWCPDFIWGNDIAVSPISKPLAKISLVLPQNSFTYAGFVFSNLSSKPFLGQLKCFTQARFNRKKVYNDFNDYVRSYIKEDKSPVYGNVKFFEALPIATPGIIYDPLLPLPLNTLVRAGAGESKPLWMRFSSQGFPAGKYNFVMVLKPSYPGFNRVEIPVELEVKPVDLATVKLDSVHCTYTNCNYIHSGGVQKNLVRYLADSDINVINFGAIFGTRRMQIYPKTDKEGNILSYASYDMCDKLIEEKIRCGIARERIKLLCYLELPGYGMAGNRLRFNSPEWKKAFKSWILHFTEHMKTKHGITKDRIIFWTTDEPDGDINDKSSKMYKTYLSGKIIKEIDPGFRTMVDPSPFYQRGKDLSAYKKLAEVHDIVKFYRPEMKERHIAVAKSLNREIWTYGIYVKTTPPEIYRKEYWQSLRDGFTSMVNYWHLESHAGGDGFNSDDGAKNRADYGSMFMDMDMDTVLSSRREEAHMLGREDFKLAEFCRRLLKKKPDPVLQKELDMIIAEGASADMAGMEKCRLKMLDLAVKLQNRK